MTVSELKDALYDIIQGYFAGADVAWSEQNSVKSYNPFIRLKLGSTTRPIHFIKEMQNNAPTGYIAGTTMLTVDLFTHGRRVVYDEGDSAYENTAVDDMADFVNYLMSPYVDDICEGLNISIRPEGNIKDTSAVVDNDYSYRATTEFVVGFVQETKGYTGISRENWKPTPSGGGTEELANKELATIEKVVLE